jgi:DNA-binding MarR family transcriptional regulator
MLQKEIKEIREEIQAFLRLFGTLNQSVTPCGFPLSPSQVMALQLLQSNNLSITELSIKLRLERSSVSRLVDALVKTGFISREQNETNRREVQLSLTEKGETSIHKVYEQSHAFFATLLEALTDSDRQTIREGFRLLNISLSTYRSNDNDEQ